MGSPQPPPLSFHCFRSSLPFPGFRASLLSDVLPPAPYSLTHGPLPVIAPNTEHSPTDWIKRMKKREKQHKKVKKPDPLKWNNNKKDKSFDTVHSLPYGVSVCSVHIFPKGGFRAAPSFLPYSARPVLRILDVTYPRRLYFLFMSSLL